MYNPDKYKAVRLNPSQARGKERVRLILSAALALFKDQGLEAVTTNDIAQAAHIPIGSLYRYYPNKEAIVAALTTLYVDDIIEIFDDIATHPMLQHMGWDEVLLLMVESWVNYSRLSGPFAFLYAVRASPRLRLQNSEAWERFARAYTAVLKKRCPAITDREATVYLQLMLAAVEMGVSTEYPAATGVPLHHAAAEILAAHLMRCCREHRHHAPAS